LSSVHYKKKKIDDILYYLLGNIFSEDTKNAEKDPDLAGSVRNWSHGSGYGSLIIRIYGSADPDPEELFTDPEHRTEQA